MLDSEVFCSKNDRQSEITIGNNIASGLCRRNLSKAIKPSKSMGYVLCMIKTLKHNMSHKKPGKPELPGLGQFNSQTSAGKA